MVSDISSTTGSCYKSTPQQPRQPTENPETQQVCENYTKTTSKLLW